MGSRTWLTAAVGVLAIGLAPSALAVASQADPAPAVQRSVILSAFGDASGSYGESLPYLKHLANRVDRTNESAYCEAVVEGDLSGQPVVIVVTGTGGGNSVHALRRCWAGTHRLSRRSSGRVSEGLHLPSAECMTTRDDPGETRQ